VPVASKYNTFIPLGFSTDASPESQHFALFNLLAGSIDIVDGYVKEFLHVLSCPSGTSLVPIEFVSTQSTGKLPVLSPHVLDYLDRRGYLFDSHEQESSQSRMLYTELLDMHRNTTRQPIIVIPTYKCDLKCPYCWQHLRHMDSTIISESMVDNMFAAIPYVLERPPQNGVDFVIFGGEPLMQIPVLRERIAQILDGALKAGFEPRIISNAVGLASAVPILKGKVGLIQVTIDGPAGVHRQRRPLPDGDSFEPMVEGINRALEAGIRINIRVNTDLKNLPTLPELSDFAREQGWHKNNLIQFHIAPVKNHNPRRTIDAESDLLRAVLDLIGRDKRMSLYKLDGFAGYKYFDSFKSSGIFPLHRFFNCEAQINFFAFDLHGDIYACYDAAGIKDLAVGTFSPQMQIFPGKLAQWRGRNSMDIQGCSGCVSQPACGGGCQFLALEHQGTFQAPNCDSLLEGWIQSIKSNRDWLLARARAGDHVVGWVTAGEVITAVEREFGLIDPSKAQELLVNAC